MFYTIQFTELKVHCLDSQQMQQKLNQFEKKPDKKTTKRSREATTFLSMNILSSSATMPCKIFPGADVFSRRTDSFSSRKWQKFKPFSENSKRFKTLKKTHFEQYGRLFENKTGKKNFFKDFFKKFCQKGRL